MYVSFPPMSVSAAVFRQNNKPSVLLKDRQTTFCGSNKNNDAAQTNVLEEKKNWLITHCGWSPACINVLQRDRKYFDPISEKDYNPIPKIDTSKPAKFKLSSKDPDVEPLIVEYSPDATGTLFDKKTKKPFEINVLRTRLESKPHDLTFNFMSKDLSHCYGHVRVSTHPNEEVDPPYLGLDYPEYGITGKRLIVEYLRNYDDKNIGGIGQLADRVESKFCKEQGIEHILSESEFGSQIAHYKRGKKFIPPEKDSEVGKFFMQKYGTTDINAIIKDLLENSDGKDVNVADWGYIIMYLPKEKMEEYSK